MLDTLRDHIADGPAHSETPDHTILLEVSKGFFNDPAYDSDKTVQLKLPAAPETLDAALDALGVWDWRETGWRCLDCRVPALVDAITDAEDIHEVNHLAQRLADMEPQALTEYKERLSGAECQDLQAAEEMMDAVSGLPGLDKTQSMEGGLAFG